jgi:hypothetical protein
MMGDTINMLDMDYAGVSLSVKKGAFDESPSGSILDVMRLELVGYS